MKRTTMAQRGQRMLNEPVSRVIPSLAVPTIISMLVTSIYNMADTFFVGQIGTSASGAVGVTFSAMAAIQAFAFTIGMGSGANMSRSLGAGRQEEAEQFVATGFFTALLFGAVLAGVCLPNIRPLVKFLGATDTIAPYAEAYASYIFYAAPFMMASFVMNNLLRFQGLALYGMVGMGIGGVVNIALDPLFIFALGMGTAGAALATALSQTVSFCILLYMIHSHEDAISIRWRNFKPSLRMYGKILYNGVPSLGRQGIASVATILLNTVAKPWGDAAIAAMSIVSRFTMFINSAVIGFGQGFQPVCSYCYGAGKYRRVREAYRFSLKVETLILLTLSAVAFVFARPIVTAFRNDPEVIEIGTLALRLQLAVMPLWGVYSMSNMLTQSIGLGGRATLLAASRQGIMLVPLLLILPRQDVLGLLGLQMSQPVSDLLSFALTLAVMTGVMRELKNTPDKEDTVR